MFLKIERSSSKEFLKIDSAAKTLMGDLPEKTTKKERETALKTKARRLYDITNVFMALGIVEKIKQGNRKPVFNWIGLDGFRDKFQERNAWVQDPFQTPPRAKKSGAFSQLRMSQETAPGTEAKGNTQKMTWDK